MFRIRLDMAYILDAFYHHNSQLDSYSSTSLQKRNVRFDMLCTAFPMNHYMLNTLNGTMHNWKEKKRNEKKEEKKHRKFIQFCEVFSVHIQEAYNLGLSAKLKIKSKKLVSVAFQIVSHVRHMVNGQWNTSKPIHSLRSVWIKIDF